jgi:hypothetical protein
VRGWFALVQRLELGLKAVWVDRLVIAMECYVRLDSSTTVSTYTGMASRRS